MVDLRKRWAWKDSISMQGHRQYQAEIKNTDLLDPGAQFLHDMDEVLSLGGYKLLLLVSHH